MPRKISLELRVEKSAKEILSLLGLSKCEVDIYLVSDEVIHKLNLIYRKKDKPTTVLSFEAPKIPHPETKYRHLGEIYLAPKYISTHNEDIRRLLIHGILHLLGYDHIKKEDAARMDRKENKILKETFFNI